MFTQIQQQHQCLEPTLNISIIYFVEVYYALRPCVLFIMIYGIMVRLYIVQSQPFSLGIFLVIKKTFDHSFDNQISAVM